jgi:ankyrin repeat protein
MIKPVELESADGRDTWDTIVAASAGDVETLRRLLERNPRLVDAEYWYTPAVHFAVRDGHAEAVQLLLDAGAETVTEPFFRLLYGKRGIEVEAARVAQPMVESAAYRCASTLWASGGT